MDLIQPSCDKLSTMKGGRSSSPSSADQRGPLPWNVGKISIFILVFFSVTDVILHLVDAQMESLEAPDHYDALSADVNRQIESHMRRIVDGVAAAHGVKASTSYDTIFKATFNATQQTKNAVQAAVALVGSSSVDPQCKPVLASEDFAHMADARPGCFVFTGNGTDGSHGKPLHSADYDFNDDALVPGSSFWVTLVEQILQRGSQ